MFNFNKDLLKTQITLTHQIMKWCGDKEMKRQQKRVQNKKKGGKNKTVKKLHSH